MKNQGETKQGVKDSFWSHREDFTEEEKKEKNGSTDISPWVHGKHMWKNELCAWEMSSNFKKQANLMNLVYTMDVNNLLSWIYYLLT